MSDKCFNTGLIDCFWCGEATGVTIDRKLRDCKSGTSHYFGGYEPCEACKLNWAQGFVFIEANNFPNSEGQPEMSEGVYPTGNHWVVREEAAKDFCDTSHGKAFIEPSAAKQIGLPQSPDDVSIKSTL